MSKVKLFGISVAVATMTAIPVFAQTGGGTTPSTRPSTSAPSGAPSRAMPSDIKSMKASELIGKSVYSANDERIGEVDDVVTSKSNKATMAVLGVGGFLGIGEKKAAVPISELKVQGDKIVASGVTKDSLKAQPEFKATEYDKVDRERTVGEAMPSGTGGSPTTGSGSTGSSGTTGTGSSGTGSSGTMGTGSSGSTGSGSTTGTGTGGSSGTMGSGSSTNPSGNTGTGAPTGSGSSGAGSSSGSSGTTPSK